MDPARTGLPQHLLLSEAVWFTVSSDAIKAGYCVKMHEMLIMMHDRGAKREWFLRRGRTMFQAPVLGGNKNRTDMSIQTMFVHEDILL